MRLLRTTIVLALGALFSHGAAAEQLKRTTFGLTGAVLISHQPESRCADGGCGPSLLASVSGNPFGGLVGLQVTDPNGLEVAIEGSSTARLEGHDFGCSFLGCAPTPTRVRHRDTLGSLLLGWRIAGEHAALEIKAGVSAVFGSTQFVTTPPSDGTRNTRLAVTGGFDVSASVSRQVDVIGLIRYTRVGRDDLAIADTGLGKGVLRAGAGLRLNF